MASLINRNRPPAYCPGCSHETVTKALDKAFQALGLEGNQVVLVSDIGCSGLFDTFFNTHAFHGLHGRALTYATGIKPAQPHLTVVVTMGDGGLGIGGAHVASACRRNVDLTLLILNNFNYGMTGGQCSFTTPPDAVVGSGFLNRLERPMDAAELVRAAGAPFVSRCSSYRKDLPDKIEEAIGFNGFSVMDIWGICTGRYSKRNKLTPSTIQESLCALPPLDGPVQCNLREEYGTHYRRVAALEKKPSPPRAIEPVFEAPGAAREEIVLLGSAGQRILTAGEILCMAGMTAGLRASQKNEYNITVLRGPSVSELILSPEDIVFTGIEKPTVMVALAGEGVARRKALLSSLDESALVLRLAGVDIPPTDAGVHTVDLKSQGVRPPDFALASLAVLAKLERVVNLPMLKAAVSGRFRGPVAEEALSIIDKVNP
ncbi:MAG TPA: 2-oxoglutarate synthase [Desulfobacteraceae bacterium]|nr:2-oxoglutarate synthase [Desulfobacteraceae bacterium]